MTIYNKKQILAKCKKYLNFLTVIFLAIFKFLKRKKTYFVSKLLKVEHIWDRHYDRCIFICFWIIGLCTPIPFLVMLSAAHDLLKQNPNSIESSYFNQSLIIKKNKFDCNELSTGIVLLAGVMPGIVIKLIAPFFVHKISYKTRLIFIVFCSMASFLLVSLSPESMKHLTFIGVMFASASSGFGEITFLSLSTLYTTNLSLTGWSSGSGLSGLLSSFVYAILTSIGLTPRLTILVMTCIPFIMYFTYSILPPPGLMRIPLNKLNSNGNNNFNVNNSRDSIKINDHDGDDVEKHSFYEKILLIRPLFKYMMPLFIVYFSEFFINQGLLELLFFKNDFIDDHEQQYR